MPKLGSGSRCCALGCRNRFYKTPDKHFFSFPKDPTRNKLWLINIGREDDYQGTTVAYRRKNLRVCSDHFTRECFMTDARKRLTWCAAPTVFTTHTPKVTQVPTPVSEPSPKLPEVKLEVNPSCELPPVPTSLPIPTATRRSYNDAGFTEPRCVIEHSYSDMISSKDRLLKCMVSELVRLQRQNIPKQQKPLKPQKPKPLHSVANVVDAARSLGMSNAGCSFFLGLLKNCTRPTTDSLKQGVVDSETQFWRDAVLEQMGEHRRTNVLCDTVIYSNDATAFRAHSCLLAAASPRMLVELRKQKHPYRVHLADVHSSQLQLVLQFIYTGTLPTEALSEHADRLASAAEVLDIGPLRVLAEEFLSKTSPAEVCDTDRQETTTERGVTTQSDVEATVFMTNTGDKTSERATEDVQNARGSINTAQCDGDSERWCDLVLTGDEHASANSMNLLLDSSAISAEIGPATDHERPEEKDSEVDNSSDVDYSSDDSAAVVSITDGASVSPGDTHNALGDRTDGPASIVCTDSKNARKPLKCPHCFKRYIHMKFLIRHQRLHTGARPYICPQCGKSFARTNALKSHERTHTQERVHRCEVCRKTFCFARYLNVHMTIHGNKTFLCPTCGKGFTTRARLKVHSVVHTGEKPYVCAWCGRRFAYATSHENHERLHTGEKPYLCTVCGKQFRSAACLNTHQKTHSGHKPYSCSVCGLKVRTSYKLKRHQDSEHDGEGAKPFKCDVCGEAFSLAVQRMFHKRRHDGTTQTVARVDMCDTVPEDDRRSDSAFPTVETTLNVVELSWN